VIQYKEFACAMTDLFMHNVFLGLYQPCD